MKVYQHNKNSGIINFLVDARYRLLRHMLLLLWLFSLLANANFTSEFTENSRYLLFLVVFLTFVTMIYINMYFIVPLFFFRGKYVAYFLTVVLLCILGLVFLIAIIGDLFAKYHINDPHKNFEINEYFASVNFVMLFILLTTTIKLLQRWIKDSDRMSELKTLTMNLELNELKNQIMPHFLFNMLNNIKALIRNDPSKATDIIVRLSDLLRYQLYESSNEKIRLTSEINFITNFLSLEKVRRDHFDFTIQTHDRSSDFKSVKIPPNLFMPFVENAVKHSADIMENESNINIVFSITKKEIYFSCINSVSADQEVVKNLYGGLGLKNINRRLQLLYDKSDYALEISPSLKQYSINLKIPI
ncbi:Histidine kinase [Chryseobacterium taichungense]|uniref:Histidine kinase n=1 Tax=Chryseobacterium taichungense TaxID=295069 RepID=A0A1H7XCH5_9FLAO|nr:histidine kinase [Chryseobacterium taichungense]SEM31510.1 Histidine kinase [Chryseobacterium taichungense]